MVPPPSGQSSLSRQSGCGDETFFLHPEEIGNPPHLVQHMQKQQSLHSLQFYVAIQPRHSLASRLPSSRSLHHLLFEPGLATLPPPFLRLPASFIRTFSYRSPSLRVTLIKKAMDDGLQMVDDASHMPELQQPGLHACATPPPVYHEAPLHDPTHLYASSHSRRAQYSPFLRKRSLWLFLVLAFVIIVVAIGVSLGATHAHPERLEGFGPGSACDGDRHNLIFYGHFFYSLIFYYVIGPRSRIVGPSFSFINNLLITNFVSKCFVEQQNTSYYKPLFDSIQSNRWKSAIPPVLSDRR